MSVQAVGALAAHLPRSGTMMPWLKILFIFPLLCVSLFSKPAGAPQGTNINAGRILIVRAARGQPGYTLHITANGRQGIVEVRDNAKPLIQTLTCPLLQEVPNPSGPELQAVREQFITRFAAEDLDLDGYTDLRGPREFGAKWQRYCVWLFEPKRHVFEKNLLAQQMELLYSFSIDAKHGRIISSSIGPVDPLWDEYRIERSGKDRPYWPRLIPVRSCFVANDPVGKLPVAVLIRYDQGQPVVTRHQGDRQWPCSFEPERSGESR